MPNESKDPKGTKQYKVHMSEEAYSLLTIEAALRHESLKDAVSRLVLAGVSSKTIAALKAAGEEVPEGTKEQSPKAFKEEVLEGTKEQSLQEPKSPLPLSSDSLSAEEQEILGYLQAGKTYRDIEEISNQEISKTKVQMMAAKFEGMGLFQRKARGKKGKH